MPVMGIDPGLSGAVVKLGDDGTLLWWHDTPVIATGKGNKREYDENAMALILRGEEYTTVFLEAQQAMPKQGLSSTFRTGLGYGLWRGMIAVAGLRRETVRPATWQRSMLSGAPGEGKARSLLRCAELFPSLPLTKPKGRVACMDGRADAALIALWGLRRMRGEV